MRRGRGDGNNGCGRGDRLYGKIGVFDWSWTLVLGFEIGMWRVHFLVDI